MTGRIVDFHDYAVGIKGRVFDEVEGWDGHTVHPFPYGSPRFLTVTGKGPDHSNRM